jgi:hypothetical protein
MCIRLYVSENSVPFTRHVMRTVVRKLTFIVLGGGYIMAFTYVLAMYQIYDT